MPPYIQSFVLLGRQAGYFFSVSYLFQDEVYIRKCSYVSRKSAGTEVPPERSFNLQQHLESFLTWEGVASEKKLVIAILGSWNRIWFKLAKKCYLLAQTSLTKIGEIKAFREVCLMLQFSPSGSILPTPYRTLNSWFYYQKYLNCFCLRFEKNL